MVCILYRRDSIARIAHQPHMHLRLTVVLAIGVASFSIAAENEQKALTLDELVAKNVEAKGGAQALKSLQSLKLSGKLIVNEGQLQLGYSETKKRPDAVRSEFAIQGMTAVQAYDGKE